MSPLWWDCLTGTGPASPRISPVGAATERAKITDNDVFMAAAEGAVLGVGSAGIEIKGLARGTVVQRNRIRGRARIGLSVAPDKAGSPTGNTFDQNDQEHFAVK